MIFRDDGPAVSEQLHVAPPGVDHRFYGERHAGLEHEAGSRIAVVQDLRVLVEDPADAVSAILADDRIALAFDERLDRMPEVAEAGARPDRPDAAPHGLEPGVAE